jgi:hypothetical protein
MNDDEVRALVAATILALDRVDLSNAVKLEVLERAASEIRLRDTIDEWALGRIANGEGA